MTGSDDSLCCTELSIWPSCCMTGSFFVMLLIWCSSSTVCSWSRMLIGLHTASIIVGDRRCQLELPTLSTRVNSVKRVLFAPPAVSSDADEDVAVFRFRSLSIFLFFSQGTIKVFLKHHQQCIITTAQLFSPPNPSEPYLSDDSRELCSQDKHMLFFSPFLFFPLIFSF